MKKSRTLLSMGVAALIGVTAIAWTFGNAMAQFAYLGGQWTSQYQCPSGQFYPITVQIDQRGQQIKAAKITGDPCVAAGQLAFEGYLTGNFGQLNCAYVTGPSPSPLPGITLLQTAPGGAPIRRAAGDNI